MTEGHSQAIPYWVVDSSVSLKWALDDEEEVSRAVALRDAAIEGGFQMVAPSLWLYEVANGLVTAARRGRLTSQAGARALAHLVAVGVQFADPETGDVYGRALRYGVAAYDAAYLALAEALGAPLWTGDRRFYETVRASAPLVRWIGDYRAE